MKTERLALANQLIGILVPRVKMHGIRVAARGASPGYWTLEANGIIVSLAENVLLLPSDPTTSSLLDIWPIGQRKVFSARWQPARPWIPAEVVCLRPGGWLAQFGCNLCG